MFEPLALAVSAPIAFLVATASVWGVWRGVGASRKALIVLLGIVGLAVLGSYLSYATTHSPAGPLVILGGVALILSFGLVGPALFKNRVAALALGAVILAFWVLAGTGAYLYGGCVLFAACV